METYNLLLSKAIQCLPQLSTNKLSEGNFSLEISEKCEGVVSNFGYIRVYKVQYIYQNKQDYESEISYSLFFVVNEWKNDIYLVNVNYVEQVYEKATLEDFANKLEKDII